MRIAVIAFLPVIAFLLIIPTVAFAIQQVEFEKEFGKEGTGPGHLSEPSDIAVGTDGYIYVADKGNKRIHVLTREGVTITMWGRKIGDPFILEEPSGIAFYEDKLYVTDSFLNKVLIFSKDGKFIDEFGSAGSGPKQFNNPKGICVHEGIIYVADTGNHRVQAFSIDGIYFGSIGKKGEAVGQMRSPTDVATDYRGYIYVTEADNNRIEVFTPSGYHIRCYYDVENPTSIAVYKNVFFVADTGNHKIKKFDFSGYLLLSFGIKGDDHAQFRYISGIAIDQDGKVFVSDSKKNTIQIFSPEKLLVMLPESPPPLNSVKWLNDIKVSLSGYGLA
ncbi:MAG: NHL repeat-containing protein [Nitrospirota bacterium]